MKSQQIFDKLRNGREQGWISSRQTSMIIANFCKEGIVSGSSVIDFIGFSLKIMPNGASFFSRIERRIPDTYEVSEEFMKLNPLDRDYQNQVQELIKKIRK